MTASLFPNLSIVQRAAVLSDCKTYRYSLFRWWAEGDFALWIMLNPSTADGETDDPTIRKIAGYSRRWGFAGLIVVNLFAFRATDPSELPRVADPIGPDNDGRIAQHLRPAQTVICAWGNDGDLMNRDRAVLELIRRAGKNPKFLGVNGTGQPKHPLYLAGDTTLIDFPGRAVPA